MLLTGALGVALVVGCAPRLPEADGATAAPPAGAPSAGSASDRAASPSSVPPAREGKTARSERVRFVPRRLQLPGDAAADVVPARTVAGVLEVPEDVQQVGWWDGSAYTNDPFGSTVIAGHVDSDQGFGFFARLLLLERGDVLTVSSGQHRLSYRVSGVRAVDRSALATDSAAFDQSGDHRLVLITCTGRYDRSRGGYEQNLVITAKPIGSAR